jgi:spore germination cell wall hydrolase CwlJ-like protein
MFWRRVANLFGTIRTELMSDFDKNPLALRQGAAAALTVAAVAAAMPAISYRAAEQRSDSAWAERVRIVEAALESAPQAHASQDLPIVLASLNAGQGYTARAHAALAPDAFDRHAVALAARVEETAAIAAFAPSVNALAAAQTRALEVDCLAEAIYYEARSESYHGQLAVAEVVVNRVRSKLYPDTYCGVVYEGSHRVTGCQFTFTCDGSLRHKPGGVAWVRANVLASQVIAGAVRPVTHRATHYHTTEILPYWSASLVETTRIGAHIFYRFPNRRERAALAAIPPELQAEADVAAAEIDAVEAVEAISATGGPAPMPVALPVAAVASGVTAAT